MAVIPKCAPLRRVAGGGVDGQGPPYRHPPPPLPPAAPAPAPPALPAAAIEYPSTTSRAQGRRRRPAREVARNRTPREIADAAANTRTYYRCAVRTAYAE